MISFFSITVSLVGCELWSGQSRSTRIYWKVVCTASLWYPLTAVHILRNDYYRGLQPANASSVCLFVSHHKVLYNKHSAACDFPFLATTYVLFAQNALSIIICSLNLGFQAASRSPVSFFFFVSTWRYPGYLSLPVWNHPVSQFKSGD